MALLTQEALAASQVLKRAPNVQDSPEGNGKVRFDLIDCEMPRQLTLYPSRRFEL